MSRAEVIQFTLPLNTSLTETISKLNPLETTHKFTIGPLTQDANTIQIITEAGNPSGSTTLLSAIQQSLPTLTPKKHYHIPLHTPFFGASNLASAPVVEYVQSNFPVSLATPEFRSKIIADFNRFEEVIRKVLKENEFSDVGMGYGWIEEEQEWEGEKVRCFLVARGWETMADFERLTGDEVFKRDGMPIVLGWEMKGFEMWHVQQKL